MIRPTRLTAVPIVPGCVVSSRVIAAAIVALTLVCPGKTRAQQEPPREYVAHILGLWSGQDEKAVTEALVGWSAIREPRISREAHRVKFLAETPVSEAELDARLSGTGTSVFWLAALQADGSLAGDSYDLHAFPVLIDTGDPAADNARYDADKAAWWAAHPGWVDVNSLWDRDRGTPEEMVR